MANSDHAEWTTSRIKRLLRPLKCKCLALSSDIASTHGATSRSQAPELMPLEALPNIGVRIHLSREAIQTLQLSKKIYAIRDCYSDMIMKTKKHLVCGISAPDLPALPRLTTLCSVMLGAQISYDEEESHETEDDADPAEELYGAIPPIHCLRALFMHALHLILNTCPPHAGLYLVLLDVTLQGRLYSESEVLVDVILDFAFESAQDNHPRISHPAHKKFLVDLYCKWNAQFPPVAFVRLVTRTLQGAPHDSVWTSKAMRQLARKLGRDDCNQLPPLIGSLMDVVLMRSKRSNSNAVTSNLLRLQLIEWFNIALEAYLSFIWKSSTMQITITDVSFLEDILSYCRCWMSQRGSVENEETPDGIMDVIACFYTLWLVGTRRPLSQHDTLSNGLRHAQPRPSTYLLVIRQIFRNESLDECEETLHTFSSALHCHKLYLLKASFWAYALRHIEDPEVEQTLMAKNSREVVRKFRLRLIDNVDEAEKRCFAGPPNFGIPHDDGGPKNLEASHNGGKFLGQWDWEPAVGCWFRKSERKHNSHEAPSKRRKTDQYSCLPDSLSPEPSRRLHSKGTGDHVDENGRTYMIHGCAQPAFEFVSILSKALSCRTDLQKECAKKEQQSNYHKYHGDDAEKWEQKNPAALSIVNSTDIFDGDKNEPGLKDLNHGQCPPSEDFLDLLGNAVASSPVR